MTKETTGAPKARKTPEQALAALQAKQKALALKAAKLQREIDERKAAADSAKRAHLGKLAADAGLADLPDAVLIQAFAEIAARHTSTGEQQA